MGSAEQQAELWKRGAQGWKENFEPTHMSLWKHMLKITHVGKDTKFFDAGCGAGGASVLAKELGAEITGFDATQAFIDICKERIPEGEFQAGDLESLPYEGKQFDVVFAANSVQFTENPGNTLSELKRVCKSNGKIVLAVWPPPEENGLGAVIKAVQSVTQRKPAVGPFALSAPGLLDSYIQKANLKVLSDEEIPCDFVYENFDALWSTQRTSGPNQAAIELCGEAPLIEAVRNGTKKYEQADGRVILTNKLRVVLLQP